MMMATSFGIVSQIFLAGSRAKDLSVVSMFVSVGPIAGIIADNVDKEIVTFVGISGIALSQVSYLLITSQTPSWWVAFILLFQGGSVGIFQSPNNALIMETVERRYFGIAGYVNSLARNFAFFFVLAFTLMTWILALSRLLARKRMHQ